VSKNLDWYAAEKYCRKYIYNGHLASIVDEHEQQELAHYIAAVGGQ